MSTTKTYKRYGHEERAALLAAFGESGLSQAAFAQERNIPVGTLHYWLRQRRRVQGPSEKGATFVRVQARLSEQDTLAAMRLELRSGMTLHIHGTPDVDYVARLVQRLAC